MFSLLADQITARLCTANIIEAEDADLYCYGFYILLTSAYHFIITAILGLLYGILWESVLFYIFFTALRVYAGGVHAKTEQSCLILTDIAILICVIGIVILKTISSILIPCSLLAIGLGCIWLFSPLDTNEKPLSQKERSYYRSLSLRIGIGIIAVALCTYTLGTRSILYAAAVSFGLESILLIIGMMTKHTQGFDPQK